MNTFRIGRLSILTLVAIALRLVPLVHPEFLGAESNSTQSLRSHDCAGKEIHRALTDGHQCSVCQRHMIPEADLVSTIVVDGTLAALQFTSHPWHSHARDFFAASSKRGPPSS